MAEAQRFLDEAAEKQRLHAAAAHAGLRSARVLSFEKEYAEKDGSKNVSDFSFIQMFGLDLDILVCRQALL